jgi:tRNA threonylcarbamoyladenosine biosynthesis protein TsaB
MKILALEFSSARRSVAVLNGAGAKPFEVTDLSPGREMRPFDLIESALRAAGLEREEIKCIAVGIGPGSYAGIRVAISLAQGWQLATGVKLLGVSSVAAIAKGAVSEVSLGKFTVIVDAQRGEFYAAGYEVRDGLAREVSALRIASPEEIQRLEAAGECLVGPEATRWFVHVKNIFPTASLIAELAAGRSDFISGERLEPIYLRETAFVKSPPAREIRS